MFFFFGYDAHFIGFSRRSSRTRVPFEINFDIYIFRLYVLFFSLTLAPFGDVSARVYIFSPVCNNGTAKWVKSLPKIGMNDNVYDTYRTEIFIATALYFASLFVLVRFYFYFSFAPFYMRSHLRCSCLQFYTLISHFFTGIYGHCVGAYTQYACVHVCCRSFMIT